MPNTDKPRHLIHDVPMPSFLRILLVGMGIFAVVMPALELRRGVWPLNILTPFFAVIIIGAWSVGFSALKGGLFGYMIRWHITPGMIDIKLINPFQQRHFIYKPSDVEHFSIQKHEWSERGPTWAVEMLTKNELRFETISFDTIAEAEKLKEEIQTVFIPCKS